MRPRKAKNDGRVSPRSLCYNAGGIQHKWENKYANQKTPVTLAMTMYISGNDERRSASNVDILPSCHVGDFDAIREYNRQTDRRTDRKVNRHTDCGIANPPLYRDVARQQA